jgi:hypothetical protein
VTMEQMMRTLPVAVWVESIGPARQAYFYDGFICDKSADFHALSSDRQFTVESSTNALSRGLLEKFERFIRHGFTVIEIPESWLNQYSRPQGWLEEFINQALEQVMIVVLRVDAAVPEMVS